jgi:uncharacterized protein DUF6916
MVRSQDTRGVTRRRLLAGGAAAGAALAVGVRPGPASAAATDVPDYLGRSSYLSLSTLRFGSSRLGSSSDLTLEAVRDLDSALAGSEDAFSLLFTASSPFSSGIRTLSHPDLGVFDFLVGPIEGGGKYEVVVNRSVNAPKHVPKRQRSDQPSWGPDGKKPLTAPVHSRHVRRLAARRVAHGVVCDITLTPDANLRSATVWLTRAGLPVATATVRHVHGKRVAARMLAKRRLRGGRYQLTVATRDRHGHTEYSVQPVVLH